MSERDTHIVLTTRRLRLRQFTRDNADRWFDLNSDPEAMRFLGLPPSPETLRDKIIPANLALYQRYDWLGTWAAEERASGEFLGWFHLRALVEMAFTGLDVERVFGYTMTVNAGSRRVMEKCGFTLVRTFPYDGPGPIEGAEQGEVEYAVTHAEWQDSTLPRSMLDTTRVTTAVRS